MNGGMRKARYLAPWHRDLEELTAAVGGVDLEKLGEEELRTKIVSHRRRICENAESGPVTLL
jgi:hypothetical protein